jgi:hypothetical protein
MKKLSVLVVAVLFSLAAHAQYPLVNIYDIQYIDPVDLASGSDLSYLHGDTVQIEGVVSFDPCDYGLSTNRKGTWVQSNPGAPFAGVEVLIDPSAIGYSGGLEAHSDNALFIDNFQVGNTVRFTGIISNFSANTQIQILPIPSSIEALGTKPDPIVVTIDELMNGTVQNKVDGEQYEGTYVEIQNVFVANVVPGSSGRFQWDVTDGLGNFLPTRDASGHFRNDVLDTHCPEWIGGTSGVSNTPLTYTPPVDGASLAFIRGTITESFGEYFIAPHDLSDVGPATSSPPIVSAVTRTPVVPTSSETVTISANIADADGTITVAELYYAFGLATTTFTMVPMTNSGADVWTATVPGPGIDSTIVKYYFRAVDNGGNITFSPDDEATNSNYIVYDDGINSIARIQKNELGFGSPWAGQTLPVLDVEGVVTAGLQTYDLGLLAIQDGVQPWSGIFVRSTPGIDGLFRGDRIRLTSGTVVEEFGVTYLQNATYEFISSGNPLPAPITTLLPDTLGANIFLKTEPYEAMLLRFVNATVTSLNADAPGGPFGEWKFNTTSAVANSGLRADDLSSDIPFEFSSDSIAVGQVLPFVQGLLYFSFSNYKLVPRNRADIAGFTTNYPNAIVSFRFDALVPSVNATIDQVNNTITATVPFGTDLTSLVPTVEITGQLVSPVSAVAQDFSSPVVYTVTAPISGEERDYTVTIIEGPNGLEDFGGLRYFNLYPNPATDFAVLDLEMEQQQPYTVQMSDLLGRVLEIRELNSGIGRQQVRLDLSAYTPGNYLVTLSAATGTATLRLHIAE